MNPYRKILNPPSPDLEPPPARPWGGSPAIWIGGLVVLADALIWALLAAGSLLPWGKQDGFWATAAEAHVTAGWVLVLGGAVLAGVWMSVERPWRQVRRDWETEFDDWRKRRDQK